MMLASKLQISSGEQVRLVNAPNGFSIQAPLSAEREAEALVAFVSNRDELAEHKGEVVDHGRRDHLTWVAYPTAGQLDTDLNRDIVHAAFEAHGLRTGRQVAVGDAWSALRLRPS